MKVIHRVQYRTGGLGMQQKSLRTAKSPVVKPVAPALAAFYLFRIELSSIREH
jgi:hypothetical protein